MNKPSVNVIPYLSFAGNCEEALNFYREAIGGEMTIVNRYDNPAMNAPENYRDKVLHARLEFDGGAIYASDAFPGQNTKKTSGDISISLLVNDSLEKARDVYQKLSAGGKATMPFDKQFWGDWHGGLVDKYGIGWNINFMEAK